MGMSRILIPNLALNGPSDAAVQAAAAAVGCGRLGRLARETARGLAADAHQAAAVRQIFSAKGRPADHPLIVHLAPDWHEGVAHHTTGPIPDFAQALDAGVLARPLTLILPRRAGYAELG